MSKRIARVKSEGEAPERHGAFDSEGFTTALDATRAARRMTWRDVASQAGVSASTLTRMMQGKRPDVDSLAALSRWAGLAVDDYVKGVAPRDTGEPLAMISTYLRADRSLSPEAARALDAVIRATYEQLREKK